MLKPSPRLLLPVACFLARSAIMRRLQDQWLNLCFATSRTSLPQFPISNTTIDNLIGLLIKNLSWRSSTFARIKILVY